jgi:hypothetical protein
MTSIFSSLSAQFGKALILGTLLPVSIFSTAGLILLQVLLEHSLWDLVSNLDTGWQVLVLSFVAIVLSGLLVNLNVPLTRLYEGYPWAKSWIGRRRTARYQRQFDALSVRWRGLRTLLYFTSRQSPSASPSPVSPSIQRYLNDVGHTLRGAYPLARSSVLPTRLGNVIRSFENYPRAQYGMSAIPLWPRLLAKIDTQYAAALDAAKISFDFALNCSFLSAVLAVAMLALGLFHPLFPASPPAKASLLAAVAACLVLSYLFYLMMVGRAAAWGEMVKGAFDLYRRPLLAQLAYEVVPQTLLQERALWADISQQLLFGDSPRVRPAEFTGISVAARGSPDYARLEVTRGVSAAHASEDPTVTIAVRNATVPPQAVNRVIVTDFVPQPFHYVWGSANVPVTGANPYEFEIGRLEPGQTCIVTYCMTQLGAKPSGGRP